MYFHAAQRAGNNVLNDDLVTVACIFVIGASVLWIVGSRLVLRNLRRAADVPDGRDAPRDMWKEPPPPGSAEGLRPEVDDPRPPRHAPGRHETAAWPAPVRESHAGAMDKTEREPERDGETPASPLEPRH